MSEKKNEKKKKKLTKYFFRAVTQKVFLFFVPLLISHWLVVLLLLLRLLLMMHVLVVVAECHRIDGIVRSGYDPALQDFLGRRAMRPRSRLRCVGERQPGGVDDTVTPHQRYGNLRKKKMTSINLETKIQKKTQRNENEKYLSRSADPLPTGTES